MSDVSHDGLRIQGLSKRFGDLQAVDELSLHVPKGALIGFLGPNGAGKTTTMRAILGMVQPDGGSITWNGEDVTQLQRSNIGYMPQERGLYARMKAHEQVAYFGELAGMNSEDAAEQATYWLERVELTDRADSLVQELSGGNQQRVQLAVSLVHSPDLLVLDEPFAGLDPVATDTMRQIISDRAEAGASVLFSSHQLDLVSDLAEDVVIVANGRMVASGAISDLRAASPRRLLRVRWSAPVEGWQPLEGAVVRQDAHSAVVNLPASADVGAHTANVMAAGPVIELNFEPPQLDEMFGELVNASSSPTEVAS